MSSIQLRRRCALIAALLALSGWLGAAAPAQAQQSLVASDSEIGFVSTQMGVPVEGRFRRFSADLSFDPRHPETSRVAFDIDLTSVSIGARETEAELAKPGWFDSRRFPHATFKSTSIRSTAPGRFEIAGRLNIKGIEQDVVVPVALTQSGSSTSASGSFVIKRLAFRIGDGDWNDPSLVADDVQVRFKLALRGIAAL